jgi:hypothetical protein
LGFENLGLSAIKTNMAKLLKVVNNKKENLLMLSIN